MLDFITPCNYDAGIICDLMPGGSTSIGDGLEEAQTQLSGDLSGNTPAILLKTDGLQNTAPLIETVEPTLGATRLCVVGFGTEASLDGPLLSQLAGDHGGVYLGLVRDWS
ncbi:MAG: VWA domain-containing protein [Verrucomicrobia subdivision 3 bacterium]|nr:VWA domain-containing protein [Limisphaerales bacterium]